MRVLFIYPVPPEKHIPTGYNFGVGYCSAVLKKSGHKTSLLILDKLNIKKIKEKIDSFKPGLIGFSLTTDQFKLAKQIIGYLDKRYKIPIILGGVHPTVAPEESINVEGVIGICRGEGEFALLDFVEALEKKRSVKKIKNFWVKDKGKIIRNSVRPLIQNLDELPFCDREIFNYKEILKRTIDGVEFIAGRGCPFSCTFCINHVLQNIYKEKGKYVRLRSVENVLKEIEQVSRKYKIDGITFHDDTFTLNKEWLREFCEKYSKKFKIPFRSNVRADTVDKEILSLLKKAGCDQVWVGVESGDDHLRNSILNKNVSTEKILKAFNLIRKYGIKSRAFNMMGIPYETCKTAQETINLSRKLNADLKCLTIFRPYPGTKLYDLCKEKGWISKRDVHGYYEDSILDQPSISKEDLYFYHKLYFYYMYFPFLVPVMRALHRIKIFNTSLFCILQPKQLFYFMNYVSKKMGK